MNYRYTSDLLTDVLFRAGEPTDASSDYYARALVYLNRAYQALCQGGNELSQSINEDWLWLVRQGSVLFEPKVDRTLTATLGSTTITFNTAPTDYTGAPISVAEWVVTSELDIGGRYRITAHTAGSTTATIDTPWVKATGSYAVSIEKLAYSLPSDTIRLISPLFVWTGQTYTAVEYSSVEHVWTVNPRRIGRSGLPTHFALANQTTITLSAAPLEVSRAEYEYLYLPPELTNATGEEPVVPLKDRRILADIALFWLFLDKNDNRFEGLGLMINSQLRGMASENRAALAAVARRYGSLIPHQVSYQTRFTR